MINHEANNSEIDYAVKTLKYLTEKGKERIQVTEFVGELGITKLMLRKIMQELAKKEVVASYKSNNGCFILNKGPVIYAF